MKFQRAHISRKKAGCAQQGPGARALENDSGSLDSFLALPHLLAEWFEAICSLRLCVNAIIIPFQAVTIKGSKRDSARLGGRAA